MREFDRCPTCGHYDLLNRHKCPPVFQVRSEQDDDPESAKLTGDQIAAPKKSETGQNGHGSEKGDYPECVQKGSDIFGGDDPGPRRGSYQEKPDRSGRGFSGDHVSCDQSDEERDVDV